MKVLRSTLVAATVFVVAACGDKVEIIQDTANTAPRVNSVSVSPANVAMTVNQTVTFSAVVDVSNGAAQTVTWSPTSGAVSVSSAGVATASAVTAGVAVCATSTADATKRGCASAVVTGTTTSAPSISIAAVNFTNGFGVQQPAPVPPGAVGTAVGVGPQLNVIMNVNAGTARPDSVHLRVGGRVAYRQVFTPAQAGIMLGESVGQTIAGVEPANQFGTTITASFNTADYCSSANANTIACAGGVPQGTPTYLNGNQPFQALFFGTQTAGGSPTNTQGQSPVATYRFANLDGFHASMTIGNGVNTTPVAPAHSDAAVTANDQAGFKWVKGSPSISALFIAYTPGLSALGSASSVASVLATIGAGGCSAGGPYTISLTNTSTTNTIGPWTGTWVLNTTAGVTVLAPWVNTYQYNPAVCPAAFLTGGDVVNMAAIGSDGNAVALAFPAAVTGVGVLNTFATSNNPDPALVFRLDNVAPPQPQVQLASSGSTVASTCSINIAAGVLANADLGGRTNCWVNDAVVLNGLSNGTGHLWAGFSTTSVPTRTANGVILSGADLGSGRIIVGITQVMSTTFQARAGLATDANSVIDATAAITSTAGLAETAGNAAYLLRIRSTDLMGNTRQTSANAGGATLATASATYNFGVDRTSPVLTLLGGIPHGTRLFATPAGAGGTNYNLFPNDPSVLPAIGSGFFALGSSPLTTTQSVRNALGSLNWCGAGAISPPTNPTGFAGAPNVYQTSGTACTSAGTALGVANPNTSTGAFRTNLTYSDTHASIADGYYTATNTIVDQAGNVSAVFTLLSVQDGTNAAWGGLSYTPAIITPGGTLSFTSTIGDNVDVQAVRMSTGYGTNGAALAGLTSPLWDAATNAAWVGMTTAAGGATFWQFVNGNDLMVNPCPAPTPQPAATCTTAPTTLVSNTAIAYPVPGVSTNIQVPASNQGSGAIVGAGVIGTAPFITSLGNNLMTASGFAFNQGVNIGVTPITAAMQSTVGISLGAVSPAIGALNNGGGGPGPAVALPTNAGPARWVMCAVSATGGCIVAPAVVMADPPASGAGTALLANFTISRTSAGGVPNNVTLSAVAEGTTVVFQNPFSSVAFYAYDATAGLGSEGWRLIGTVNSATSTSDLLAAVPNGRNWFFTMNWVPNLTTAPTNSVYRVMAVGIANSFHTGPPTQVGAAIATPLAFTTVTLTP